MANLSELLHGGTVGQDEVVRVRDVAGLRATQPAGETDPLWDSAHTAYCDRDLRPALGLGHSGNRSDDRGAAHVPDHGTCIQNQPR